tara:strand:- start:165 stop:344 length:180 start_codon:yes stop_codon:yes gene_type:complete
MMEIILGIAILTMVLTALVAWMILTIPTIQWIARQMGINPKRIQSKIDAGKEIVTKWVS